MSLVLAALVLGTGLDAFYLSLILWIQRRQAANAVIQDTEELPRPTGHYAKSPR